MNTKVCMDINPVQSDYVKIGGSFPVGTPHGSTCKPGLVPLLCSYSACKI